MGLYKIWQEMGLVYYCNGGRRKRGLKFENSLKKCRLNEKKGGTIKFIINIK